MTLERREQAALGASQPNVRRRRRSFWRPKPFELLILAVIVAVWTLAIFILIKHEGAGFFVSAAYVLLGLIGAAVSWLLLWPLLRILIHAMENE